MISLVLKRTIKPKPTDIFDIVSDGIVVGMCQLRHKPSKSDEMPDGFENHIYYEIKPEFQRKGYATEALRQLISRARDLKMKELIIAVDEDNIASQKVIEKNGGILMEKKEMKNVEKRIVRKYSIKLS